MEAMMVQSFAGVDLPDHLYQKIARLVYHVAGISLGDNMRELVRSRLIKRLRLLGMTSFQQYYDTLARNDPDGEELVQMLNAISTNKTDFFRENQHFTFLAETLLPALTLRLRSNGSRRIRLWSAGCSSGEEPYTIAMVLRETLDPQSQWDARILATDISTRVLHFAHDGLYEADKLVPVPPKLRFAHFDKERRPHGVFYRVKPHIKEMVSFRRLNLMNDRYPFSGKFHVIFCRNVMIYFDRPTQEKLVNRYYECLEPGGYLFIGHSESLTSLKTPFQFIRPTIYVKPR